jgi:hypothetical protein
MQTISKKQEPRKLRFPGHDTAMRHAERKHMNQLGEISFITTANLITTEIFSQSFCIK